MTDDERLPEIVNVACYASVVKAFTPKSRWRVRGTEERSRGKYVVILERVKK